MPFNAGAMRKRLEALDRSQESIHTMSTYVRLHKASFKETLGVWWEVFAQAAPDGRLALWYVLNDVLQRARKDHDDTPAGLAQEVMERAVAAVRDEAACAEIRPKVDRVLGIWRDRGTLGGAAAARLLAIARGDSEAASAAPPSPAGAGAASGGHSHGHSHGHGQASAGGGHTARSGRDEEEDIDHSDDEDAAAADAAADAALDLDPEDDLETGGGGGGGGFVIDSSEASGDATSGRSSRRKSRGGSGGWGLGPRHSPLLTLLAAYRGSQEVEDDEASRQAALAAVSLADAPDTKPPLVKAGLAAAERMEGSRVHLEAASREASDALDKVRQLVVVRGGAEGDWVVTGRAGDESTSLEATRAELRGDNDDDAPPSKRARSGSSGSAEEGQEKEVGSPASVGDEDIAAADADADAGAAAAGSPVSAGSGGSADGEGAAEVYSPGSEGSPGPGADGTGAASAGSAGAGSDAKQWRVRLTVEAAPPAGALLLETSAALASLRRLREALRDAADTQSAAAHRLLGTAADLEAGLARDRSNLDRATAAAEAAATTYLAVQAEVDRLGDAQAVLQDGAAPAAARRMPPVHPSRAARVPGQR
ncbi:hypothetical protein FNF28_07817 [Cafeteria roenbergensis]|uniref:CID domain-containing protein n=1 Tax=Cafeteria roenbergensis TaxID=33653 RepID=A0A5A8BYK7_CAFRO|nr:hypothetical protein FNF28_07817 [Cafeteria roenbergensis]